MNRVRVVTAIHKEEDIRLPHFEDLQIQIIYAMMYTKDVAKIFAEIDKSSLNMLMYVMQQNLSEGRFSADSVFRKEFGDYLQELTGQSLGKYHDQTIYRSVRDLTKVGVFLRLSRSRYAINPKYFYQGDPKLREMKIQEVYKLAAEYEVLNIHDHNDSL